MHLKRKAMLLIAAAMISFCGAVTAAAAKTERPRPATVQTEKPRPEKQKKTETPEKRENPRPAATKTERSRARGFALKKGDCIGVLAPASWESRSQWESGVRLLKKRGYRVKLAPSCTESCGFFAGTDERRAADLNAFFRDDEVRAILCLRGGYGSGRILDMLDYAEIARHPKLFIGYSDITALHIALGEKSGIVTVHGPMLTSLASGSLTDYTERSFFRGVMSSRHLGSL